MVLPSSTNTLIVGGGLSGLMAAWHLHRAGRTVHLVEARTRFGGRILTTAEHTCDLGPSWFWPGQPLIARLITHFGLEAYDQFADGITLHQRADGYVQPMMPTSPMAGAFRLRGGLQALVDALAADLPRDTYTLGCNVTGITRDAEGVRVTIAAPTGSVSITAKRVALAIPPRLAGSLTFTPDLPPAALASLQATPTWMAGHAKFFAVYERPFWREQGLCGSAISQRGPLAEIHDASTPDGAYSLFGFVGLDGDRRAILGPKAVTEQAMVQLGALFGPPAKQPIATFLQDWSVESFTAHATDRVPQTRHPQYGLDLRLDAPWARRLAFISSETSFTNGGLVEGALESGLAYAQDVIGAATSEASSDAEHEPHKASMGWDWL
ncbi:MAG: NAD(P)/FAD-dependent oxidoreductase [Bacteroidota bacterium]